jgi:hypothetical protein
MKKWIVLMLCLTATVASAADFSEKTLLNDWSAGTSMRVSIDLGNVTGNMTIGGTLDVTGVTTLTGAAIANAGITTNGAASVFNEGSGAYDFRVESDSSENAIKVNGTTNRVGVFTASPTVPFDVTGESLFTGAMSVAGGAYVFNSAAGAHNFTVTAPVELHTNSTSFTVTSPTELHTNSTSFTVTSPILQSTNATSATVTSPVEQHTNVTSHTITSPLLQSTNTTSATFTTPLIAAIMGTTGGLELRKYEATTGALAGASGSCAVNVPAGAILVGTQLRVDTLITSGDGAATWGAAYATGATQAITTGQAFLKDTKANGFFNANGATAITSNVTTVTISPNANTFSGGVVRCITYALVMTAMANAP